MWQLVDSWCPKGIRSAWGRSVKCLGLIAGVSIRRLTPSPYCLFCHSSQFSSRSRAFGKGKETAVPWSQRLSFNIIFFHLEICGAKRWSKRRVGRKRKPLVATVGNLTFMPLAFDHRFWLEDIFNCSMSHMIGWIKYLWGWEWSVHLHLYGYGWRTFALSTDSLTDSALRSALRAANF